LGWFIQFSVGQLPCNSLAFFCRGKSIRFDELPARSQVAARRPANAVEILAEFGANITRRIALAILDGRVRWRRLRFMGASAPSTTTFTHFITPSAKDKIVPPRCNSPSRAEPENMPRTPPADNPILRDFHFNFARQRLFRLRQAHGQQTVLEVRRDLFGSDLFRQGEAAGKTAVTALDAMIFLGVGLRLGLAAAVMRGQEQEDEAGAH
jgi:hypothetical protein